MAVGKTNRFPAGKAYTAKLKLKDGTSFLDIPEFEFQTKQGTEYVTLTDEQVKEVFGAEAPIRDIAGDLVSLDVYPGEFEGKPIHNITLGLRDSIKSEIYLTQFVSNNNIGRSIANSILNLQTFTNVQLGLWGQENRETKKVYPACSIRQGESNDTVKWKFDPKTTPEMKPREFEGEGRKIKKDWTAVDDFIFGKLKELGERLKSLRSNQTDAPKQEAPATTLAPSQEAPAEEANNDGPPF